MKLIKSIECTYTSQDKTNKFGCALNIWIKAFINKPSFYLISELPKIVVNTIGIGIYAKSNLHILISTA